MLCPDRVSTVLDIPRWQSCFVSLWKQHRRLLTDNCSVHSVYYNENDNEVCLHAVLDTSTALRKRHVFCMFEAKYHICMLAFIC